MIGGSGEIRTHGQFLVDSFQDCCNKPDSATLPNLVPQVGLEPTRLSTRASKTRMATITSPGQFSFFYIMVEIARFEPTHPKEQIYSLPRLSNCAVSP